MRGARNYVHINQRRELGSNDGISVETKCELKRAFRRDAFLTGEKRLNHSMRPFKGEEEEEVSSPFRWRDGVELSRWRITQRDILGGVVLL